MSLRATDGANNVAQHLAPENTHSFAIKSIERVINLAKCLKPRSSRFNNDVSLFSGTLCSVLLHIKSDLQKHHGSGGEGGRKIERLLNNLERLCSWPRSLVKDNKRNGLNRWPTLTSLQYPSQFNRASGSLKAFASTDSIATLRSQDELLKTLRGFYSKSTEEELMHAIAMDPGKPLSAVHNLRYQNTILDIDEDIKCLYQTLQRYRLCGWEDLQRSIATQIRLNGYRNMSIDGVGAEFGVFFFDHPHTRDCHWQETCIRTSRLLHSKIPSIRFKGVDDEQQQTSTQSESGMNPVSGADFCRHISVRSQAQLLLSINSGELLQPIYRNISRNWLSSQPPLSLATLIDEPKANFTPKMKAVLALLLAKATVQFYDSDLIGDGLTKENVQFLFEERDRIQGVYVNEPMLSLQSESYNTNEMEGTQASRERQCDAMPAAMIHDMPKVLALGLLLLEIETGKSMETYREDPDLYPNGPVTINTDYNIAKRLLDPSHPAYIVPEMDRLSPFRTILPLCIKPGEFARKLRENSSAHKTANSPSMSSDSLRSAIHTEIVLPLESWVSNYDKPDSVNALYKSPRRRQAAVPQIQETSNLASQYLPPTLPVSKDTSHENRMRESSRKWFADYDQLKDVLQAKDGETGNRYQKVKVCVLDTGINPDDYTFYHDYGTIVSYKDYVDIVDTGKAKDVTGHGSAVVSLLVKAYPDASLYLARVLKTNSPTQAEVGNVAIDWATSSEVDIIIMALGFKAYLPEVANAITRARAKQILVFSAVSNTQNMNRIYFPARDHEQVFGIFSANSGNRESVDINPSPDDRPYSFAIFGQGIEIAENLPLVSGTSYSTSIAAGLAALLLDFSRQKASNNDAADLSRLVEMRAMTKVLLAMAEESGDRKYKCIRPWDLLNSQLLCGSGVDRNAQRSRQREWIWGTIERLLEKI